MWIQKITLKNYRNYLTSELEFSPGLNVFIGKNAQGKTNFLEAIYFLSLTRSHRTRTDKELIHFDAKELLVARDNQGMLQPFHFLEQTQPSNYGCNFADYQRMVNEYKNR